MPSASKTSAKHSASCLWMEYIRLLGSSTAMVLALSVLLHTSYCELADDSAHWWETLGLVLVALACGLMLCRSGTSAMWYALGGTACTLAWWLHTRLEHRCDMHGSFLVVLGLFQWSAAGARSWAAAFDNAGPTMPNSNSEPQSELPLEPEPTNDPTDHNPPSRRRPWWPIWLLIVGLVIYMVVVPSIAMLVNRLTEKPTMVRQLTDMSPAEYLRLHSVSGVIMCLFLAMGASVGSFLNVVIYRFPRGRALLWPPSACPSCHSRIATRDNIPILAWLYLGGRCRHCGVSISARYPLVEAAMAAICVLFYYRELLSGGANLPVRIPNAYHGIVWILLYTKWDLVTIYLFHMLLLALVMVIGFVNLDRFRLPVWSRIAAPLGIVALVTLAPHLNPSLARAPAERLMLTAFMTSLIGCAGGALVGWCLARLFPVIVQEKDLATEQSSVATSDSTSEPAIDLEQDLYGSSSACPSTRTDMACALAMLGAALGLQAVIALGFGLLILMGLRNAMMKLWPAVGQPVPLNRLPITWLLLPLAVAQLALWNWIHLELPVPYL